MCNLTLLRLWSYIERMYYISAKFVTLCYSTTSEFLPGLPLDLFEIVLQKNIFLRNEQMSIIKVPKEDRKYALTVSGHHCRGPCLQAGYSYWWCGYLDSQNNWDYCSPPYKGSQKTCKGEDCVGPCQFYKEDYYYCDTKSSWDYCSKPEPYDEILSPMAEEFSNIRMDRCELPNPGEKCKKHPGWNFLIASKHSYFSF